MTADNPFLQLRSAGYKRLVPIVPPGAQISPRSTLFTRPGAVGKAPGVKGDDGLWRGVDWLKLNPTDADFAKWFEDGAGVGIRTGGGLVAVDIDVLNESAAQVCTKRCEELLDFSPRRIGRYPKRLHMYRVSAPVEYRRIRFEHGQVELLSEGRQFVAIGVHPVTLQPYQWPDGLDPFDELPEVTPAQLTALFDALRREFKGEVDIEALPAARNLIDQAQLLGDAEIVAQAVTALPNTTALFPTYDDYVRVGYAIKGATQDQEEGLALFQAWAAKWEGGNDPDRVAADWFRMKPPFEIGAQYLYELAEKHSGGRFAQADAWFDEQAAPADLNPFEVQAAAEAAAAPAVEPIAWLAPTTWEGRQPPERLWEVEGWIPRGEVTLLYGDGGIGKTLLAHQYATAAAAGRPWLGLPTRPARVMCFFCEDSEDELHRRQLELCAAAGLSLQDIDARLRIASRKFMDNLLAVWSRHTTEMRRTIVWQQLRDDALAFGADVIIVDTLADTFGGSEIDRGQVNAFVKSCLGRLVADTGASLIALGHPSVSGMEEGRSGSTGWSNASRSRLFLRYPNKAVGGDARELKTMKLNYGAAGGKLKLKWSRGAFEVLASSSPRIDLNAFEETPATPSLEALADAAIMAAWRAADGLPLSIGKRARSYAPDILRSAAGTGLAAVDDDEITAALRRAVVRGAARADERGLIHIVTAAEASGDAFN